MAELKQGDRRLKEREVQMQEQHELVSPWGQRPGARRPLPTA